MYRIGDILYCNVKLFGNKPNRPCILIEIDENSNTLYVLPVTTSKGSKTTKLKLEVGWIACCSFVLGYLYLKKQKISSGLCVYGHCGSCNISPLLKLVLKNYGITI